MTLVQQVSRNCAVFQESELDSRRLSGVVTCIAYFFPAIGASSQNINPPDPLFGSSKTAHYFYFYPKKKTTWQFAFESILWILRIFVITRCFRFRTFGSPVNCCWKFDTVGLFFQWHFRKSIYRFFPQLQLLFSHKVERFDDFFILYPFKCPRRSFFEWFVYRGRGFANVERATFVWAQNR